MLLYQVNALVQRECPVPRGVGPFRKIEGRVDSTRYLPEATSREEELAPVRNRLKGTDKDTTRPL